MDIPKLSGSSRADKAVDPTRVGETNMTVSWRRVGSRSLAGSAVGLNRTFDRIARNFTARNAAMASRRMRRWPDRRHAEVPEVLGRQLGQACLIDRIFPECLPIAFQAEAAQPGRNVHDVHTHTWPHSSAGDNRRLVRE